MCLLVEYQEQILPVLNANLTTFYNSIQYLFHNNHNDLKGTVDLKGGRWSCVEYSTKENPPKKYFKKTLPTGGHVTGSNWDNDEEPAWAGLHTPTGSSALNVCTSYSLLQVPDPWHFCTDPDPDPALFVNNLMIPTKNKCFFYVFWLTTFWMNIRVHHSSKI